MLLIAALIFLFVGLVRGLKRAAPWYAGTLASAALLIGAVLFYRANEMQPRQMGETRQMARLNESTAKVAPPATVMEQEFAAAERTR